MTFRGHSRSPSSTVIADDKVYTISYKYFMAMMHHWYQKSNFSGDYITSCRVTSRSSGLLVRLETASVF